MMPAVTWFGRNDVRIRSVAEPGSPAPGMVNVRVRLCGLCGTDVSEYLHGPVMIQDRPHPLTGRRPPITLGHELAGVVSAVGDGVPDLVIGDRVTADACWRCGTCAYCRRGDYHICVLGGALGLHSDGALAPYVQIPAYMVIQIPEGLDDGLAALAEPAAVGFHAADRADASAGLTIVVIGFGVIGTFAAMASRIASADVVVIEADAARREIARSLGFECVIDARAPKLAGEIRALTDGLGADTVIDCTGQPGVVASALRLARRGGSVVVAGISLEPELVDLKQVVLFERRIVGTLGYRNDLPRVLGLMSAGTLDASRLVTEEIPLEQTVTHGLDVLARREGDRFKILVRC